MAFFRPAVTFCEFDYIYRALVTFQEDYKCIFAANLDIRPGNHNLSLNGSSSAVTVKAVSSIFFTSTIVDFSPKDLFMSSKLETVIVTARGNTP